MTERLEAILAKLESSRANGDPEKYLAPLSVADAHFLARAYRAMIAEAVSSATAARQNFHTVQIAANQLRIERDRYRDALTEIIAADDDFRASMAPSVEKDPVTLACDRGREALKERP